jgi:phage shock protein A
MNMPSQVRKKEKRMAGYEGILGKVKLLLTANIQDLLNRALNTNKPAVFDEQINLLQGSLEKITVALGESLGREKTLTREVGELKETMVKTDTEIDRLLELEEREDDAVKRGKIAALATNRQANYNSTGQILELKEEQLEEVIAQTGQLQDAKIKLSARIDTLRAQKTRLLALISERKAAEAQGRALSTADILSRFSPEGILREEEEALERAKGIVAARSSTVEEQLDDLLGNDALQQQLEERRARRKQQN